MTDLYTGNQAARGGEQYVTTDTRRCLPSVSGVDAWLSHADQSIVRFSSIGCRFFIVKWAAIYQLIRWCQGGSSSRFSATYIPLLSDVLRLLPAASTRRGKCQHLTAPVIGSQFDLIPQSPGELSEPVPIRFECTCGHHVNGSIDCLATNALTVILIICDV